MNLLRGPLFVLLLLSSAACADGEEWMASDERADDPDVLCTLSRSDDPYWTISDSNGCFLLLEDYSIGELGYTRVTMIVGDNCPEFPNPEDVISVLGHYYEQGCEIAVASNEEDEPPVYCSIDDYAFERELCAG